MDNKFIMYLKNTDEWVTIPEHLQQVFSIKLTSSIGKNEIIKMKNEGIISERDIEISKFLFKFKFATLKQISTYLGQPEAIQGIKTRLEKLIKYRIINKFMLADESYPHIEADAFQIYCLDLGGKFLLSHFSNEETYDWSITTNMKASEIISKDILTTEFYLKLSNSCPNKLKYFNSNPEFTIGKTRKGLTPSFEFCLEIDNEKKYFWGEIVRNIDMPSIFMTKILKYEELLRGNGWKKYCYDSNNIPLLLIFSENDLLSQECSKMIDELTLIESFRASTDLRLQKSLDSKGAFLKYMPMHKKLKEVTSRTFTD